MSSETEIDLAAMRRLLLARRDDLRDLWRKNLTAEGGLVEDREPDWTDLAGFARLQLAKSSGVCPSAVHRP